MHHAHPKLKFIPQKFNPLVLKIVQWSLPILLRFRTRPWLVAGITQIETNNVETLVEMYQKFQAGKIRFLISFRHPEVEDPFSMLYLFSRAVPKLARQKGIRLQYPIHSHFIYDRGMTVWAGAWLGWLFSRVGGFPIHRGRPLDRIALKTAREILINGRFPLTVAPEGATNGHSEIVSPLEPGVAQFSFWCVEDLLKAGRSEEVFILPVNIQYQYVTPPWKNLDKLLSSLEADSGLPIQSVANLNSSDREKIFSKRLSHLAEHLLTSIEQFYTRFYHCNIPQPNLAASDEIECPSQILVARLRILLDTALQVAENYFGIENKGTIIDRCRRLEEAGWNYIYREDITDLAALSPLDRGLADWVAKEADLRLKHMRLVESFVAVTEKYILEKPTVERFAETALILFDAVSRLKGTKMPRRPRLGKRLVRVTVGEPISASDRYCTYRKSRQAARVAVTDLTQDLQLALERMINLRSSEVQEAVVQHTVEINRNL